MKENKQAYFQKCHIFLWFLDDARRNQQAGNKMRCRDWNSFSSFRHSFLILGHEGLDHLPECIGQKAGNRAQWVNCKENHKEEHATPQEIKNILKHLDCSHCFMLKSSHSLIHYQPASLSHGFTVISIRSHV